MKTDNQNNVKEGQQIGSKIKRSNIVNEFFWICSGANRHILRQCPTEYSKYFGIGGTIFFTAAMAALSGGYAFFTIFDSTKLAVIFGVFWGLLIFNLDRFIVNTMYSDGKHTISKSELISGLPRIIIAIFLGIVISTPLEMKIFEDRIESQIKKDNVTRIVETKRAAEGDYTRRKELENELKRLNDERSVLAENFRLASEEHAKEISGQGSKDGPGDGPIAKAKEKYMNNCDKALKKWDVDNRNTKERIENELARLENSITGFETDIDKTQEKKGFCVRYEAFSNIKKNPAVRIVSLFIMLLFIIIETAPTLFKMMIASGPYDELLKEEMERKKAQAILNISRINDDANTQIQIAVAKNQDKLAAEIKANQEILSKIAAVQAELLETAIDEWRKEELAKIKTNPSQYIQSNTKKS